MTGGSGAFSKLAVTVLVLFAAVSAVIALRPVAARAAGGGDDPILDRQWALAAFNAGAIRTAGYHGQGVVVAVVGGGVNRNFFDLSGNVIGGDVPVVLPGANCSSGACRTPETGDTDPYQAGTGIASIIAAHGHLRNGARIGMLGLATRAQILPVQYATGSKISPDGVAASVRWAVAQKVRIIDIDLFTASDYPVIRSAVADAVEHGVIVVAPAGDDNVAGGLNLEDYPGGYPGVVDVGAVARNKAGGFTAWSDSDFGPWVTVAAPGVSIMRAGQTSTSYLIDDSTVNASAYVAGEAALLVGEHPSWTAGQIIHTMLATVHRPSRVLPDGKSPTLGFGVIDPYAAVMPKSEPTVTTPTGHVTAATGGSSKQLGVVVICLGVVVLTGLGGFAWYRSTRGKPSPGGRVY